MLEFSHPLSAKAKWVRWGVLGFLTAPLVGAWVYAQGYSTPFFTCPIRHFTGIPCPSCGMTRSFMALAQGNWEQAVAYHLFGPVLVAGFIAAIVHVTLELQRGRSLHTPYTRLFSQRSLQVTALIGFLSYYALRLYHGFGPGELQATFWSSPIGQWLFADSPLLR